MEDFIRWGWFSNFGYCRIKLNKGRMLEKHLTYGFEKLNKMNVADPHYVISQFVKGMMLSDFACAMYNPDDELVFATQHFMELFNVQPGPQTFEKLVKHCFENNVFY